MRKYRCPHCGEKVFTSSQYNIIKLMYNFPTIFKDDYYDVIYCPVCSQPSMFTSQNPPFKSNEIGLSLLIILTAVSAVSLMIIDIFCIGIALLGLTFLELFFQLLIKSKRVLLPCNREYDSYIVELPLPNCRVKLNDTKYLKNYGTYAIKFEETEIDFRFSQLFPDGLVPIQLYKEIGNSMQFEARLIKKKYISSNLLYDGAKFLIEDVDGVFVAEGTFIKVSKTGDD